MRAKQFHGATIGRRTPTHCLPARLGAVLGRGTMLLGAHGRMLIDAGPAVFRH